MNNKLEGPALAFFDKMLLKWVAESNTSRMLGFYSTKVSVSKAMDLMSEAKPNDKTRTEHFQYLVYVAERAGRTSSCCSASVTRHEEGDADSPRLRSCWLHPACMGARRVCGGTARSGGARSGRGGLGGRDGHGGQGAEDKDSCDKEIHLKGDCPARRLEGDACCERCVYVADNGVWILDSGSNVHLVNDENVVERDQQNSRECWIRLATVPRTPTIGGGTPVDP
ncbi:LOW QUALITY PROTEIN: hypothetical protein PHMEG_00026704 [Phytophthora megakarya]|uniref:Uncharacterized protein n=1 Tax=Phytophthora megakarya TaxID=4795 RepID=A0A225VA51_9STRA|nr:LOW QUALITY PROTEIN: hypothetical protein PHMEG_00026704 [Phytophthora megakarya]